MTTVEQMSEVVPVRGACAALSVAPASYYRWKISGVGGRDGSIGAGRRWR